MIETIQLKIRLTRQPMLRQERYSSVGEIKGGPEVLLRWLETQLGLPSVNEHRAMRISEYAAALDSASDSVISASFKADRWATASALMARQDELLLAGWDGADSDDLPEVVHALAGVLKGRSSIFPSEAERLKRILKALKIGQILPPHCCILTDALRAWPFLWRKVLAQLNTTEANKAIPHAVQGSTLHTVQSILLGGNIKEVAQDQSLRYVQALSQSSAVEVVGAILSEVPEQLSHTVICCEDDALALQLDACLHRMGLPTSGVTAWSCGHPILQVLPLCLALLWEPVDPQALLDFLVLPVLPLPRMAAMKLAEALAQEPGLGSRSWELAIAELCAPDNDPDGKLRNLLDSWLYHLERVKRGNLIPTRLVRERCNLVVRWASMRASRLAEEKDSSAKLIDALRLAAGQAALIGELAESQGGYLSDPQLARLLDETLAHGVETSLFDEVSGGPMRVRSLAEIDRPCERLIWLGLGTADAATSLWSAHQLRKLRSVGIDLDDGSNVLSALRAAEVRGFSFVREACLSILLPQDSDKRDHPIWLAICGLLPQHDRKKPQIVENLITQGCTEALFPFSFQCREIAIEPPQKRRTLWDIPGSLMSERSTVSATELQDRLACPLKWTLNYQAKLRPSPIARLPDDFQLKGTFCHSLLERVFGGGGPLPSVDDAVRLILAEFDQRIALDAAPLAQPDKYPERQRLRHEVERSTRVLIQMLASGGYSIVGIEEELNGEVFGKRLIGSIDCIVRQANGQEGIIDFKYGGSKKYHTFIKEGKAVQLATYAYGRASPDGTFPAVGYFVISDGLLYTPSGSPLQSDAADAIVEGESIRLVWEQFVEALEKADDWLTKGALVPARPLQDPSLRPAGTSIVLNVEQSNSEQPVCKFCHYKHICGKQELS